MVLWVVPQLIILTRLHVSYHRVKKKKKNTWTIFPHVFMLWCHPECQITQTVVHFWLAHHCVAGSENLSALTAVNFNQAASRAKNFTSIHCMPSCTSWITPRLWPGDAKTRTCAGACNGWPNRFASRLASSRKSQSTYILVSTCVNGWPNGEKLAYEFELDQTQVGGHTKRKSKTCVGCPGLKGPYDFPHCHWINKK